MTTHKQHRWRVLLAAVVACFTMAGLQSVFAEPAVASHGITITADVNQRTGPSTSNGIVQVIARGTSPQYNCWAEGQNVGGVTAWFNVTHNGRTGFVSSYYDNSSYRTNAEITTKYGIPRCGTSSAPPPTGNPSLLVWCGSPVDGTWSSSHPRYHGAPYGGDWSGDLPTPSAQYAQLYCAPQDGQSSVTARVESVRAACRSGVIGDGGYAVQIGLFNGSARIGWFLVAHVNPSVSVGQEISRWGGSIGQVGTYRYPTQQNPNSCWSGRHAHVEMFNVRNYSCYSRTWDYTGRNIYKSNFVGFLGGNYARGYCP